MYLKHRAASLAVRGRSLSKTLLVMKFTALFLLVACLQVSAKTYSQKLTLSEKKIPLQRLFNKISAQTGLSVIYDVSLIEDALPVDIAVKDLPLEDVLDICLKQQNLTYMIDSKTIIIKRKTKEEKSVAVIEKLPLPPPRVTGTVTDEKNVPLAAVSVTVKGTGRGTSTNEKGVFTIEAATGETLDFSIVGFKPSSITLTTATSLSIVLQPDVSNLNDIVVVGYGTARKKDVTGAVSSIGAKDFTEGLVTNPMDQIQGKVPGLVITKPDGDPNAPVVIRLRGQTSLTGGQSPLLVVDGVILDDVNQISNIPAADILSYDVLKDASATSIYGSRGANGVVIINTRKGRAGRTQVDYAGYVSLSKVAKTYEMLSTPDFLNAVSQIPNVDTAALDAGNFGKTNDWQKAILRTAVTHSHTIGVSGGSDKFNYRGSASYLNQQGIVINTGKEQTGLRFNAQQKALNDKLDIQVGIVNTNTTRRLVNRNIFNYAYVMPPYLPIKLADGTDNPIYQYNYQNPVLLQNMVINQLKEQLMQEYGTVNYQLFKGFTAGVNGSLTKFNIQGDYYLPVIPGWNNINSATKSSSNRDSRKGDIHLNYSTNFGLHNLSATGVYEYNYYSYDTYSASGQGFVGDANTDNALQNGNSSLASNSSYKEEFKIISFLGRLTYNYNSKYYLTASFRRDGSSKFGVNHRWGNFPAISAAWRLKNESFLKNVAWIDELKLNAGYGVVGNQDAIGAYNTLTTLSSAGATYDPTNTTNNYPVGYAPNQNPNPDLVWEERHGKNIGVEFSFMKGLLSGSVSAFNDETRHLLYNYTVQVPPNFVSTVLANVGSLTNKGVELQLNANIIRKKDFSFSVGGQITTINTKITSLSGSWAGTKVSTDNIQVGSASGRGLSANPITYLIVGKSPYTFYLPHYTGHTKDGISQFDSAGSVTDNVGNATLHYIDPYPKFNYGFSLNLNYKNWGFNAFLRGVSGTKIFNNTRLNLANYSNLPSVNTLKEAVTSGLKDNPTPSDYWLENASYMRLENLTLSYSFQKIKGIENLRFYLSGNNLFVITKYKGLDPEIATVDNSGGGASAAFIDLSYTSSNQNSTNGFYPKSRSFTLGVNISFK